MAGPSLGTAYVQVVASADGIKGSITNGIILQSDETNRIKRLVLNT